MTRRLNFWLAVLALLIGIPFWYLLLDTSAPASPPRKIDMADLRRLAESMPGQKPVRIDMELAAWRLVPGDLVAAGSGIKRRLIGVTAFRLEVPGRGPVMIESGISREFASVMGFDRFDARAQGRINEGLRTASLILVTHEHLDHIGGLIALRDQPGGEDVIKHASVNPNQLVNPAGPNYWAAKDWPGGRLDGTRAEAVAPGIVVLPAPGHTPGSQMIYVRLAGGAEYLFPGDTVSLASNWLEARPRSRLLTDWMSPEKRGASTAWLKAVIATKKANPSLHIVPSHDFEWLRDTVNDSGIHGRSSQGAEIVSGM